MNLSEAYEILKKANPLLKPLSHGVNLWKKVILDYFDNLPEEVQLRMALYLVAVSLDDETIYKKYFENLVNEKDDNLRKFMVEILKDNYNDYVIEKQFSLIGIRERVYDRYVRQIVSQNIVNAIKYMQVKKSIKANILISRIKKNLLNDGNTFTRMNAAIILRSVGEKKCLPELEKRLAEEKSLFSQGVNDVGIPYVIREIERSIAFLKERA